MDVLNLSMNSFESICKKKCAEVFYQNIENFSIVCTQCDMEAIKFEDFLAHFKEIHCCQEKKPECENQTMTVKSEMDLEIGCTPEEDVNLLSTLYEDPIELACKADIFTDFDGNIKSENESISDDHDSHDRLQLHTDSDDDNIPLKVLGDRVLRRKAKRKRAKLVAGTDTETENTCNDCGKVYKSRKALQRHIRSKHDTDPANPKMFPCERCEKTYVTLSALRAHERMKHRQLKDGSTPGTYSCEKCGKIYMDKYSLKDHLIRHSGQKNFTCDITGCAKKFFNRKGLNFHIRNMHIGAKNFVCEICGHSTKTASSLIMHKRTHTGEKPFNCSTCGKAFATQSGVAEHKVSHNAIDERPHVCNLCGKTFARKKALYHHMPLHLGIKKFVCKICGKAYSQLAGLSAHKRQHTLNNFGEET